MESMTKPTRHNLILLVVSGLLLLTVSCVHPTPIPVYVTPTPQVEVTEEVAAAPTQELPTEAPTVVAVLPTTAPATDLPTQELPSQTPAPVVTFRGPIIGPDYQLPPTQTPPPSATPTEGPSPTPPPDATVPGPQPTGVPTLDPGRMGIQLDINLSDEDWNEAMRRIKDDLNIGWVKVQMPWRDLQPNGPGSLDGTFARRIEQHLEDANQRGLNMLVSIVKAPTWARSTQAEDGPPDDPQALADFITLMLEEFSAGLARDMVGEYIDAIEIWNEPNLIREWQGTLPFSGAGYMRLFAPAYNAIRAYSPTMPIITAGLAPTGNTDGSIDDRTYLRQMYAAGLGNYSDVAIGIHPYGWGNAPDAVCCGTRGWDNDPHFFFADTVREYREIMTASGHGNTRMWITEIGWATWDGFPGEPPTGSEWMRFNDKWAQANYTMRAFEIVQSTDLMGPMFLWNLNFAILAGMLENGDERAAYSLVIPGSAGQVQVGSTNHTERPLYWMIYDATRPDVQLERYD